MTTTIISVGAEGLSPIELTGFSGPSRAEVLQQIIPTDTFEFLNRLPDVLRPLARAYQQRIIGLDDDQIMNPDRNHKFLGRNYHVTL